MWAMIEKFRMRSIGDGQGRAAAERPWALGQALLLRAAFDRLVALEEELEVGAHAVPIFQRW